MTSSADNIRGQISCSWVRQSYNTTILQCGLSQDLVIKRIWQNEDSLGILSNVIRILVAIIYFGKKVRHLNCERSALSSDTTNLEAVHHCHIDFH